MNSKWLPLIGVVIGFFLGFLGNVVHDYLKDKKRRKAVVTVLKAKAANDVYFTEPVLECLIKTLENGYKPKKQIFDPVFYFPEPWVRPIEDVRLLKPSTICNFDQYERVLSQVKRCRDTIIAKQPIDDEKKWKHDLKLAIIFFEAFIDVGRDFKKKLDNEYPNISIPSKPELGKSFEINI